MKRTNKKKKLSVDAILTADWHLREDNPTCRTDDFEKAQWRKVKQIAELQKKHDCPVLHAGDLFHHWKPSPRLLTKCIRYLPDQFYTVYGNHDLPQHSMKLRDKSGITTLLVSYKVLRMYSGNDWDLGFDNMIMKFGTRRVGISHVFTYAGEPPYPGAEKEPKGHWLLDRYSKFDMIVTGDNHQPFVCKEEGRLLVNPGSLTRQNADQADHKPRVYLYNSMKNKVKPKYLKIKTDVISRQHIEQKEQRDERIASFVERLDTEWAADLDFYENLKRFESKNEVDEEIMEICYKALEN